MESKRMHQVTQTTYDATGLNVEYGAGELHAPGSLPDGVAYTEVLADEAQLAASPAHAQSENRVEEEAAKRAEFERIQTERSSLATDVLPAAGEPAASTAKTAKAEDKPAQQQKAAEQQKPSSGTTQQK